MSNKGKIHLIPNVISKGRPEKVIPAEVLEMLHHLRYFIVEDARTARRFLRSAGFSADFDSEVQFFLLNKHTDARDIPSFLKPVHEGFDMGILSESGVPCVADPGNAIVALAQEQDIRVVPHVGPSSILLALMASGFNGQNFAFNGYLPIDGKQKLLKLHELTNKIIKERQTQIFIEAPYRNQKLLEFMLKNLKAELKLCIARDISGEEEMIMSKSIAQWKKHPIDIQKKNTIFLLYK